MFCNICLAIIGLLIYVFVFHVYVKLLILKLKHGKNTCIAYTPLMGDYALLKTSFQKFGDCTEMYKQRFQQNPQLKFVLSNIMNKPFIFLYDPEYYKQLFVNHEMYTKVDVLYHPKLTSQSILFNDPHKVKQQRNILGESFTFEKLKSRMPIVNEVLLRRFESEDKTDVLDFLMKTSSEILIRTFFCKELQDLVIAGNDMPSEIINITTELGKMQINDFFIGGKLALFGRKAFTILLTDKEKKLNTRIDRLIDDTLMPVIKHKIATFKKSEHLDFLDIYINAYLNQKPNEPKITELELCQLFVSIVSAGTDTTSHQAAMTLYFLAIEREAQDEIRKELQQVVGDAVEIESQHLNKLVLLNAFIQESFRLKPTVIQPLTRIAKETHYIKDLKIEKGSYVSAFTCAPTWNEKFYKDANKFDYKRWLSSNPIQEDNGYVFVPFSAGGRNCIGQHMAMIALKIMVGQIVRKYDVKLDPKANVTFPMELFIQYAPKNLVQLEKLKK